MRNYHRGIQSLVKVCDSTYTLPMIEPTAGLSLSAQTQT
jgi:hypothetical protein